MYSALSAVLKVLHFRSLDDTDADADAWPVYGSWLLSSCSHQKFKKIHLPLLVILLTDKQIDWNIWGWCVFIQEGSGVI